MSVPARPNPPVVGKVTHSSIELYWEPPTIIGAAKSDGRLQYSVEEGERTKGFGKVYSGFSTSNVFEGLEPSTDYRYRIRCKNDAGNSAWSSVITVRTTKKPKTNEDLHKAVAKKDVQAVIKVLEEFGPRWQLIDSPDKFGLSPLMVASQKGYVDIVKALLERNADVNYQNISGKTAMMMACFSGQLEVAKLLQQQGAGWNTIDHTGSMALHWAVDGGNLDVIRWMFTEGCAVDIKDKTSGWTPLMRVAAVNGNINIAKLLIHHGANVNSQDKDGKTILMNAVLNGFEPLVKLLVKKGAFVQHKTLHGKTALDFARAFDHERIVSFLQQYLDEQKQADKQRQVEEVREKSKSEVDGEEKENVSTQASMNGY
ncbi:fibronectin type 3 and ankyrin repeat domains protein 1 [Nematostella vectensis]|uniref:fibronectin type 3 and ankyrin repeat domains protein 1 n=1 Tax=Nematostella vectensis TaxID=45351 RepID=UPI0020775F94|nr:fibronectin type 3 and ankyrin repeat domains protein 1 [Nematostella vectensis]XP_048581554.1 fibronectin type 3 and ankyrin repeat domains protein 1 [Nematostella vectensis]